MKINQREMMRSLNNSPTVPEDSKIAPMCGLQRSHSNQVIMRHF